MNGSEIRIAGEVYDGTMRLANELFKKYGVDDRLIKRHLKTLAMITRYSDGAQADAVHLPADGKRLGLVFKNVELDRELTVWLGQVSTGDVTIQTPDGMRIGSDRHFEKYFDWLLEGVAKRNHAKLKVLEIEALFHEPFACGWYQLRENSKLLPLPGEKVLKADTIKGIYDKFRRLVPDGKPILVISALLRTGERPSQYQDVHLHTPFLEKAFYHGG